MARTFLISRVALAVALSGGMIATMAPTAAFAKKKEEQKGAAGEYSKPFVEAVMPIQKAVQAGRTALTATPNETTIKAAADTINTELGGDAKGAFAKAEELAKSGDEKNLLGDMMRFFAIVSQDDALKIHASQLRLESGKVDAKDAGALNYEIGASYFNTKDWPHAIQYLKAAKDAGFVAQQNDIDMLIAEAYRQSGDTASANQIIKAKLDAEIAAGEKPNETLLRRALQTAFDAKDLATVAQYSPLLGKNYPSPDVWYVTAAMIRELTSLPPAQNLDLMRLMFDAGALKEKRDFLEYLEDADPRAYPGEALKVMDAGLAKGKLAASDLGTEKADTEARAKSDRASLPGQEAEANKPGASVKVLTDAGDVFLSYDQPAKAEGFYARALAMPGVDANKVAMRLGIAQVREGKYADAQASFAKVTGATKPVADLWAAFAASKGA
ncbi:hypothetical protein MTR62_01690 [Novosphingobium sp. 1949]|uniref:Tetratricopeptide repeat protein n=1 Tax=Novosphingobium organovorum TaxID=2930092 RepID=A0ABT0B9F1_9SPHN|nr:hypothetical protein [Novosphingobium organovorum]MCJ2181424.1 hypothetical protein [Novosphingobium organovorum]